MNHQVALEYNYIECLYIYHTSGSRSYGDQSRGVLLSYENHGPHCIEKKKGKCLFFLKPYRGKHLVIGKSLVKTPGILDTHIVN